MTKGVLSQLAQIKTTKDLVCSISVQNKCISRYFITLYDLSLNSETILTLGVLIQARAWFIGISMLI